MTEGARTPFADRVSRAVGSGVIGDDPVFDVAILRIPPLATGTLPVAAPGNSARLRVGEEVLAIGNPLGLEQTLTRGIVSAINCLLPDTPFSLMEPMIQTDAPINPGNSGGPLLNRCDEIVGITMALRCRPSCPRCWRRATSFAPG